MFHLSDSRLLPHTILICCLIASHSGWTRTDTYPLAINEKTIDLIGEPQKAILANDGLPTPTLHWREDEDVTLAVTNNLTEPTSIHWHGIVRSETVETKR